MEINQFVGKPRVEVLNSALMERNITLEELCRRVNLDIKVVRRYFGSSYDKGPTSRIATRISEALGLSVDELFMPKEANIEEIRHENFQMSELV